jgi:hypothetical protein
MRWWEERRWIAQTSWRPLIPDCQGLISAGCSRAWLEGEGRESGGDETRRRPGGRRRRRERGAQKQLPKGPGRLIQFLANPIAIKRFSTYTYTTQEFLQLTQLKDAQIEG